MLNEIPLYIIVTEGLDKPWIKKDAGPITRWWKRPSRMQRSRRWVSENLAPGRWIAEQVSPEYSQQMDVLREVHNQVENWTKDLSNALDRAQDARKLGKPLDAIFWLGQINNRLKLVADEKNKLQDVQEKHLERYFEEHEEGIPEDYFETGSHKIVEAGVLDDLGRQMTTWKFQRAHRLRLREQDLALKKLLDLAKTTVNRTYTFLREMSKALGSGDISHYLILLNKVGEQQSKFETEFRVVYDRYFASIVSKIKEKDKTEKERVVKIKEEAEQRERERLEREKNIPASTSLPITAPMTAPPVPEPTISEQATTIPLAPIPLPSSTILDLSSPSSQDLPAVSSEPSTIIEAEPLTELSPSTVRSAMTELQRIIIKTNHEKFYKELEKSAIQQDPYLLAAMMLKYSEMIDELDPQKSLELLAIAEGILNG